MPTLNPRYNFGTELKNENPTLYNQLNDIYSNIANVLNTKPSKYVTNTDPVANSSVNATFVVGDFWVNESSDTA